jgi:hypothetical protein
MTFNSQICTTREQSERLLSLGLKKETADCCYYYYDGEYLIAFAEDAKYESDIPAWSLHRLIELCRLGRSGATLELVSLDQTYDKYIGQIRRMIKEGYFNKDYLCEK